MKRKSIAIVSDAVYPFNKGGKEKRTYDITTRLAAQGYDVTIYCMQWWKGGRLIMKNGVVFHAISPYHPLYAGERRSISQSLFFALHCFKLLNKKFDVIEIDSVPHPALFTTKIVCLLRGKKMIVTWHEVWGLKYWKEYLGTLGPVATIVERMAVRLPDLIVSVSEHTTSDLRGKLKAKRPIVTIHNGVDVAAILSNPPAAKGADIVFAGRLLSHKNVDVLLLATSILAKRGRNLSVSIIGDGPEKADLKKLAKKLNIEKNISFSNFFDDHNELYRIMQASGVFVLPSTREGFGIIALEANVCGLPVITIDHEHNATKELIIEGENGALVALDGTELADAIEASLSAKKERSTYRKYAEKYSWNSIMPQIHKTYAL